MTLLSLLFCACYGPAIGCADLDGDGYSAGLCDASVLTESADADEDPSVNPGQPEICDGIDNDDDDDVDEDQPDSDDDGDPDCTDCAPSDPAIGELAIESENQIDDDCDGEIDEGYPSDVWVDTIQDLLREPGTQIVVFGCAPCSDDGDFMFVGEDEGDELAVQLVEEPRVDGDTVVLSVEVSDAASVGYYDLSWSVRTSSDVESPAVRVSRGQVRIDGVSPDVIQLGHPDRVDVVIDGGNFSWDAVVEIWDDQGQSTTCTIDEVDPDRIYCHFTDTEWSLDVGLATWTVRDEADDLDCGGYSQACFYDDDHELRR